MASCVAIVVAAALPSPAAAARPDPPTWHDEFAGTQLDLTRWAHRATGPRHQGFLTPDAVAVADDMLTITTYTEDDTHYSGMIATVGPEAGLEQAFGYFEARVKFNNASGQWSSFWLQSPTLGVPLGNPALAGVEMDIVEHRLRCVTAPAPTPPQTCGPTSSILDRAQLALIWDGYGPASQSAVKLTDPLPGLSNGTWHTWALNWTPSKLTFLFDDHEIWSQTQPISQRSEYVILSSEVWDAFAGAIPTAGYGTQETSTTNMQVDYVRAWSTPASAPQNTNPPAASGAGAVGSALACSNGTWSGVPAPALDVQWLSDETTIAGATGPSYTVQSADGGHALSCRVTATSVGGTATAQSNAIAIPAPAPAAPPVLLALLPSPTLPAPLPPPPPPPDVRAPIAVLSGATSQRLGLRVAVTVACLDEPCRATATGTVRVARVGAARARVFRPTAVAVIGAGGRATIRLKLSRSARAAIGRALRARKRVKVALSVRIVDSAGNARTLRRFIALKRAARRTA